MTEQLKQLQIIRAALKKLNYATKKVNGRLAITGHGLKRGSTDDFIIIFDESSSTWIASFIPFAKNPRIQAIVDSAIAFIQT